MDTGFAKAVNAVVWERPEGINAWIIGACDAADKPHNMDQQMAPDTRLL